MPAVEDDALHDFPRRFRIVPVTPVGSGTALWLSLGAVTPGVERQRTRDAHVVGERFRGLIVHRRLSCLPAESAEHHSLLGTAPDAIRPARNTVAVGVMRVCPGDDVALRDGLEKAEADHGRRDTGTQHGARMHRAIGGFADRVAGLSQLHDVATGELDGYLLVLDDDFSFGLPAADRVVLELNPVSGLGNDRDTAISAASAFRLIACRNRQMQHQRDVVFLSGARGAATPVPNVTAPAAARIVERPEPVGGFVVARRHRP